MTEDDLKKLFEQDAANHAASGEHANAKTNANIDADAKRKTLDLAMAEFNRVHHQQSSENVSQKNTKTFQGFWTWLRLMVRSNPNPEEHPMKNQHKWLYSGIATASLAVFGVLLVNNHPYLLSPESFDSDASQTELVSDTNTPMGQINKEYSDKIIAESEHERKQKEAQAVQLLTDKASLEKEKTRAEKSIQNDAIALAAPEMVSEPSKKLVRMAAQAPQASSISQSFVADMPIAQPPQAHRDDFETFSINPIKLVSAEPVSTFSIDVDTASYSFVRRQLNNGVLPSKDAVRIEEMLNYFDYDYPLPTDKSQPFKPSVVVTDSPWASGKKLVHIGIKGYDIINSAKPKTNLVFLLDVSGSMNSPDKLPLVKQSMNLLLSQLHPTDTVAIAVYAGAAGTVLEPTQVKDKAKIIDALNNLSAGGSTAGAQGIQLAYELAERNFDKNAVNRIILATDGDFNVGINDRDELKGFVERKRDKGVLLSILGFGQGNYHDHLMQTLAQNGNGIAAYIDTLSEAQKVLVNESTSTLFPIAKDVKIQVEFNPATVSEYRLIGYDTRALKRADFNNDKVDARDIGAGHTVTAIYEITPTHSSAKLIDDLRYGKDIDNMKPSDSKAVSAEYGFLKLRYKLPNQSKSQLMEMAITAKNSGDTSSTLSREINFATAVAAFAQQLKDPKYLNDWSLQQSLDLAQANKGDDAYGYRTEFVQLIRKAMIAKTMNN